MSSESRKLETGTVSEILEVLRGKERARRATQDADRFADYKRKGEHLLMVMFSNAGYAVPPHTCTRSDVPAFSAAFTFPEGLSLIYAVKGGKEGLHLVAGGAMVHINNLTDLMNSWDWVPDGRLGGQSE